MTDIVKKSGKHRMLIDFDCYNKDILLQILNEHLQKGYMLSGVNNTIGFMTFEPAPAAANVTYAVIQTGLYSSGGEFSEPWKKCGSIGDYAVYRSMNEAEIPEPDSDLREFDKTRKKQYIRYSLLLLLCAILEFNKDRYTMWTACKFSQSFNLFYPIAILCYIFFSIAYFVLAFKKPKRDNTERGRSKYLRQYVIPGLWIPFVLAVAILTGYDAADKDNVLPDSRLPFSGEFSEGQLNGSSAARRYVFRGKEGSVYSVCLLYEARFDGLAPKVFEEIKTGYGSEYPLILDFGLFNAVDTADSSAYSALDDILLLDEATSKFNKDNKGVIVRSGDVIFGICYNKEAVTEEYVLQYLDEFFANS